MKPRKPAAKRQLVVLYEAADVPMAGLKSRYTATMVKPGSGAFKLIQNGRWADDGLLTVRGGIPSALSSAIGASGAFRGFFVTNSNNGQGVLYATVKLSTNVTEIYRSTDAATWTAITASSGKYGDTRLESDGSNNDYETSWAVFHDKFTAKDILVAQNGYAAPRIYNGTAVVKHEAVPFVTNTSFQRTVLSWKEHVGMGNGANWNIGVAGAGGIVLSDPAVASPNDYAIVTINAAATNDTCSLDIVSAKNWQSARQILFVVEANSEALKKWIQGVRIQVRDTAGAPATKTLYDPYDAAVSGSENYALPVTIPTGLPNVWVLAYNVPMENWISTTADRVTFTWSISNGSGATSSAINILSIAASNYSADGIKGRHEHAISYYNSGSLAESQRRVLRIEAQALTALGCRLTTVGSGNVSTQGVRIPFGEGTENVYYTSDVFAYNTTTAQRDKGVDTLRVYRREYGEEDYYYSKALTLASWGGASWSYATGSAGSVVSTSDGTQTGDRLFWLRDPGSFNLPIPVGRAMCAANDRLIVGAKATDSGGTAYDAFQRVCVSRRSVCTRFGEVTTDDPDDPAEGRLPGENVQAIVAAASDLLGSATVYVFTDASVQVVNTHVPNSPLFLTRASSVGTGSPNSVVEREGRVYFLDLGMRVRRLNGTPSPDWISKDVDDKFQNIPVAYRRGISAMWHQDRVYFAYVPDGGTAPTRILIYSEKYQLWESDDYLSAGANQANLLLRWVGASGSFGTFQGDQILFANSSDRKIYRFESGTTDAGTNIALAITTGDLSDRLWRGFTCSRWAVMCFGNTGTLTGVPSYKPVSVGGIAGGVAALTNATLYDWRWSTKFTASTTKANGNALSLAITGTLPGLTLINALAMEVVEANVAPRGE